MDEEESIKINVSEIKKGFSKTIEFFKQKKVLNILIIILFLVLLIGSSWMRLQNLPLLKDSTTGGYIPLALDPFYFLRIAETIVEQGGLPEYDLMRYPSAKVGFSNEILPGAVVLLYKMGKIFDKEITLQYIDVISPVIFFALGLIVFFFLIYVLTNSKMTALLSSIFLAIIPLYLYRTMAGFADHESIGMFAFFLTLLCYSLALKFLGKQENQKNYLMKTILFGLLVGFVSAFTIASWGGIASFVFMIIPLSFGLFWIIKTQNLEDLEKKKLSNFLIFYISLILSTILFGLIYGFSFSSLISKVLLTTTSLINGLVLMFLIVDFNIIKFKNKLLFISKEKLKKYRILLSILISIIVGVIFLSLIGKNIFSIIPKIMEGFLHPFGTGRVGLTVAENRQPFLNDWIGQTGKIFFWLFFGGLIALGVEIAKGVRRNKNKILFGIIWVIFVLGILFSRISASSIFNGVNFISKLFYIGSLILFFGYMVWIYFKDKINIKSGLIILFSWAFFMLISARGAIRLFFVITPFVCFSVAFFIIKVFNYTRKSKDDLLKLIFGVVTILVIIGAVLSFNNFLDSTMTQAKYTGPSANVQWQNAMFWVRENTPTGSIFVHWWDYGYWVQTLGKRPTIADGGYHPEFLVHKIGRYVLTTPKPETALSFFKTMNISYFLIDPTDLGKYPAYSKIGSDEEWDRFAYISPFISKESQIQETSTGTIRIYQGGMGVDEDIIYEKNNSKIFIPGPVYNEIGSPSYKAFVGGIIFETIESNNNISLKQPEAVFMYNNQQIKIPLRYVYINGEIKDFENGLDAVFFVLPKVNAQSINNLGAGLYLSPKVSKSLFAQLYLMDDVLENYETIKLVHSEDDQVVKSLKMQGLDIGEFVYYQGFRGPIKIWEVDYPSDVITKEEFLRRSGDYAEFDDLEFRK